MPALMLGTLMATLDISAVNIALPTLSRDFGLPLTAVQWVVLAYMLTITGLLLGFGRLADRYGRRRIYGIGLAVFVVGSLLCALAPSATALIAARAFQGLGAAMMTANSAALLVSSFPPEESGKALGVFGAMVGVGLAAGPPLGGLLIDRLSWRWIFLINLPLGLLAQWRLRTSVPADPPVATATRLDLGAVALWTAGLVLVVLGVSHGSDAGWDAPATWGSLAAGALALIAFAASQARSSDPLLPPGLLLGPVGNAALLTLIGQALSIAIGIHMPLFLEGVNGFDAARSGRWMAILPLAALLLAPLAGRWSDRFGPRPISATGMALVVAGLLALSNLGDGAHRALLAGGMLLAGLGFGLFTVPNASMLLSAAPTLRLGLASGLQGTMRNLGISMGAAAATALLASRYAARGGGRLAASQALDRTAFALASHDLYLVMSALALAGVALVLLPRRAPVAPAAARE